MADSERIDRRRNRPPAPVTDRQLDALRFIAEHIDTKGYPPTLRELCAGLGIEGTNAAQQHVTALKQKGLITRPPLVSRGIVITPLGRRLLSEQRLEPLGPLREIRGGHPAAGGALTGDARQALCRLLRARVQAGCPWCGGNDARDEHAPECFWRGK